LQNSADDTIIPVENCYSLWLIHETRALPSVTITFAERSCWFQAHTFI